MELSQGVLQYLVKTANCGHRNADRLILEGVEGELVMFENCTACAREQQLKLSVKRHLEQWAEGK